MRVRILLALGLILGRGDLCQGAPFIISVANSSSAKGTGPVPVAFAMDLSSLPGAASGMLQFRLVPIDNTNSGSQASLDAQFEAESPGSTRGRLCWLLPPGAAARQRFALEPQLHPDPPRLRIQRHPTNGHFDVTEDGQPVLRYNYQTNEPGTILAKVSADNLKYARARGDYIHPLYGLNGEELTRDWSQDHPHHRGIYWAWPEVEFGAQRGDLHALQRVFARPSGRCAIQSGPVVAQIDAENLWLWEDREPIVRERAVIRAWHAHSTGRFIDLEFHFTALKDGVTIARRETRLYGGLNVRLAPVRDQQIGFFTDPAGSNPRSSWAELSGRFAGGNQIARLAILQFPSNPDYPGDWVKYPDLNWFQPTFPAAGTRYPLAKDQPLVLRYRLWVRADTTGEADLAPAWNRYAHPPDVTCGSE